MTTTEFAWDDDLALLRRLSSSNRRPNLMVLCSGKESDRMALAFRTFSEPPFHTCRLPGPLELPWAGRGTLMLENASALTLQQQMALHDWIERADRGTQIISMSAEPLYPLVLDGRFLEGLFYRLNVVTIDATANA